MNGPIVVRRTLNAPRERVFAAWTRPELLGQWFFAVPNWTVSVDADVRVGGQYRLEMRDDRGGLHVQHGEYRLIEPVSKLVFTWSCAAIGVHDSVVTIQLDAIGDKTAFQLTHDDLPRDSDIRRRHDEGWTGCLANLDRFLTLHADAFMTHTHHEATLANATPAAAYAALTTEAGYRAWWAKNCDVSERPGGEATLHFDKGGTPVMMKWRVDEQLPDRRVMWTCIGHDAPQWIGTTLDWSITQKPDGVEVALAHGAWHEPVAEPVKQGWRHFVCDSLKSYLETGVGKPW